MHVHNSRQGVPLPLHMAPRLLLDRIEQAHLEALEQAVRALDASLPQQKQSDVNPRLPHSFCWRILQVIVYLSSLLFCREKTRMSYWIAQKEKSVWQKAMTHAAGLLGSARVVTRFCFVVNWFALCCIAVTMQFCCQTFANK